uniref:Uncharacterized protein n=1 Tax=Glossina pallidipes TaxID=7398 RepID=A0A1A9ZQ79_GLOPL
MLLALLISSFSSSYDDRADNLSGTSQVCSLELIASKATLIKSMESDLSIERQEFVANNTKTNTSAVGLLLSISLEVDRNVNVESRSVDIKQYTVNGGLLKKIALAEAVGCIDEIRTYFLLYSFGLNESKESDDESHT